MIKIIIVSAILFLTQSLLAASQTEPADSSKSLREEPGISTQTKLKEPFRVSDDEIIYIKEECKRFANDDGIGSSGMSGYMAICITELTVAVEKAISSRLLLETVDKNPEN